MTYARRRTRQRTFSGHAEFRLFQTALAPSAGKSIPNVELSVVSGGRIARVSSSHRISGGNAMKLPRRNFLHLAAGAAALPAVSRVAWAQAYPSRPVRLIVPFPPGGTNDIVARAIAPPLSDRLGKQVVVDNRAGASAVVGSELVANAPKDGHTLLVISLTHAINPWLYKLPYDPVKGFAPVAVIASGPLVLTVHPDLQAKSVNELIALAKAKPGQLQYASPGIGTPPHLSAELFKIATGIDMLHVPFRGGGPANIDLIGGHTKLMFNNLPTAMPHIRSGKLRALGVGGIERAAILPDVPTIAEAGVPGYEANNWWGILAPAGTPTAIVERLHNEIAIVQSLAEVQRQLATEGAEVVRNTSAEFGSFLVNEMNKWERVVKTANIKAE
jgi:tripartite-type tricarboxylate transporter receptor subunit TctC